MLSFYILDFHIATVFSGVASSQQPKAEHDPGTAAPLALSSVCRQLYTNNLLTELRNAVNVSCLWFTNIELKHAYLLLKMPSKAYNRRKRYKEKYNLNIEVARTSATKRYKEIREDKLPQAKIEWVADKQLRKRQRSATQRTRDGNSAYKERNRAKSLQNTKRRFAGR